MFIKVHTQPTTPVGRIYKVFAQKQMYTEIILVFFFFDKEIILVLNMHDV
jgi:hypothetical protein